MIHRQWSLVLGLLAAVAVCGPAAAAEPAPEEVLQAKGLRKLNQYFVLADEAEVNSKFRELDLLRKKVADAQQKASAAEQKVEDKKKLIVACIQQQRELNATLATTTSVKLHNKLVLMHNELVDRVSLLTRSETEEKAAAAARTAVAAPSEQYIDLLMKVRAQFDKADEQYTALTDDPKVQQAIEDFNKGSPNPVKLGPTPAFALLDRKLKKLESSVLSETIALRRGDGNLWQVTVSLNGKHAQEMIVDTGASIIALPYGVAEAAGMTPSANDPTIRVSLADGRIISAKQVFAASVRLGKFTVEHVECAVMPADLTQAQAMLGLSFFKHFTYKIDSAKGKLAMSQIEQAEKAGRRKPARGEPRGTAADGSPPHPGDGQPGEAPAAVEKHAFDDQPPATQQPAAQPGAAEQPGAKSDPTRELAQLLKSADDQSPHETITLEAPDGGKLSFQACKQGPAETLAKRFGSPEEITKISIRRAENGRETVLRWKIWTWGGVRVLVDESGKTRFYAVGKE
ncbi:MAG: TIGR02281 family clan AA aspartic protease [Thermoguttaceae bacterium]|jgi:aspartyl protease family protein